MSRFKFVSLDRIFAKIARDLGNDMVSDENNIIEWSGEALEFIGAITAYEEAVAFIEVKNHQCELPTMSHNVIQIARNRCWKGPTKSENDPLCPKKIVEALCEVPESPFIIPDNNGRCIDCDNDGSPPPGKRVVPDYVLLDCNGQPLDSYEVAYYRPYFDFKFGYNTFSDSQLYKRCFLPVRLKANSFFDNLVCEENGVHHHHGQDEYTIIQGSTLRFNFKDGHVAIAYNRQVFDEATGYPMIPDHVSYITAIAKYITMKMMEKQFYAGRDGAKMKLDKAESDWQWYCGQAGAAAMMPHGVDDYQDLLDQRSYLLPRNGRYFGFFGNLSKPENRIWDRASSSKNWIP